jgi:hypothetical protein
MPATLDVGLVRAAAAREALWSSSDTDARADGDRKRRKHGARRLPDHADRA